MKSPEMSPDNQFYVYALSLQPAKNDADLENMFYIGKGKGLRWKQHFKDAEKQLKKAGGNSTEKLKQIQKLIADVGVAKFEAEKYVTIVATELTEETAHLVETLMILITRESGIALTNIAKGRHEWALLRKASDVRRFFKAETKAVDWVPAAELAAYADSDSKIMLLVSGRDKDLSLAKDVTGKETEPFEGIRAISTTLKEVKGERRGWNPYEAWEDDEARERARHYWSINEGNVRILQKMAAEGRLLLGMLVSDPAARTKASVVRYVWEVSDQLWNYYYEFGSWGFPLGEAQETHPWIGKNLQRKTDGKAIFNAIQGSNVTYAVIE